MTWHRELVDHAARFFCETTPSDCLIYDGKVTRRTWPKGKRCVPCRAYQCIERRRKRQTRNAARARRKGRR